MLGVGGEILEPEARVQQELEQGGARRSKEPEDGAMSQEPEAGAMRQEPGAGAMRQEPGAGAMRQEPGECKKETAGNSEWPGQ